MRPLEKSRGIGILVLLVTSIVGPEAYADRIRFDGVELEGSIKDMNSSGVTFDIGYGTIVVPYDEIEDIRSDGRLYILFGDSGGELGRVLGIEDGMLLVGDSRETATSIPVETILDSDTEEQLQSWGERMRNRYRYWTASVNAGLVYSDETVDELDVTIGAEIERKKAPTRFLGRLNYLYGQERGEGSPTTKDDNELRAYLKGEYDPTERFFLFTSHEFENDEINEISLRWIGVVGPGIRVIRTEKHSLQFELGPGYYYQRNHGGDEEEYATVSFGVEAQSELPFGAKIVGRTTYAPAVDEWEDNYVIISEVILRMPLSTHLSWRVTLQNTYDNTPADDVEKNESKVIASLAFEF